jgi:exosortase
MIDAQKTRFEWAPAWYWHLPGLAVLAWWILDLQVQWRVMVEYQYGWLVLMLSGYLVWERLGTRPKNDSPAPFWLCVLLGAIGAPLVLVAELVKNSMANSPTTSFVLSVGCCLFLAANILYLHGPATLRHFLFPLLFLFVAVPLPPSVWRPILLALKTIITRLDVEALNLLGIPAKATQNVIQLPKCTVGVEDACSGIRSLQSCIMAGLFLGNLVLKRFSLRCVTLAAGIGLALLGNFLRSLYLALTAAVHGPEAVQSAHDSAGWSILVFTTAGLMLFVWWMERLEKKVDAIVSR